MIKKFLLLSFLTLLTTLSYPMYQINQTPLSMSDIAPFPAWIDDTTFYVEDTTNYSSFESDIDLYNPTLMALEELEGSIRKKIEKKGSINKKRLAHKRKRQNNLFAKRKKRKKIFTLKSGYFICSAEQNHSFSSAYMGMVLRHFNNKHNLNIINCLICSIHFDNMDQYYAHNTENHYGQNLCLITDCSQKCMAPTHRVGGNNMFKNHSKNEWKKYIEESTSNIKIQSKKQIDQ